MAEPRRLIARGEHGNGEVAERTLGHFKAVIACCDADDLAGAVDALSRALGEFEALPAFARDNPRALDDLLDAATNLRIGAPRPISAAAKAVAQRALSLRLRLIGEPG